MVSPLLRIILVLREVLWKELSEVSVADISGVRFEENRGYISGRFLLYALKTSCRG